jgi:hypothetical protein
VYVASGSISWTGDLEVGVSVPNIYLTCFSDSICTAAYDGGLMDNTPFTPQAEIPPEATTNWASTTEAVIMVGNAINLQTQFLLLACCVFGVLLTVKQWT